MGAPQRNVSVTAESGVWDPLSEPPSTGYQEAIAYVPPRSRPAVEAAPRLFFLNRIVGPSRLFQLRKSIGVSIREEEDGTSVAHSTLPVQGFGMTLKEALQDLQEMFEVQYLALVECDISELAPGTERVRSEFETYVSAHEAVSDSSR